MENEAFAKNDTAAIKKSEAEKFAENYSKKASEHIKRLLEIEAEIEKEKQSNNSLLKNPYISFAIELALPVIISFTIVYYMILPALSFFKEEKKDVVTMKEGYKKETVFNKLSCLAINSNTYDDYKYTFETAFESHFSKVKYESTNNNINQFYLKAPSLTRILKDAKSYYSLMLTDSILIDSGYYAARSEVIQIINVIISENEKMNPYDGLTEEQIFLLNQVNEKIVSTGNNHNGAIPPELEKISQELKNQKRAIDKYLQNSEDSYNLSDKAYSITYNAMIISIIALALTFIQFISWGGKFFTKIFNFCNDVIRASKNVDRLNELEEIEKKYIDTIKVE